MMYPDMVVFDMFVWDHVVAAVICILAPVLAITSRNIITEEVTLASEDKIHLYHSNSLLLVVFSLVVLTTWRIPGRPISEIGIDWPSWHPWILIFLTGIFILYGLDIFFQYGNQKRRERTLASRQKSFAFVPSDWRELTHFLFLALAAGIGEEIIFRGYLIHYLVYWTGSGINGIIMASVASSALFAFLHGYQGVLPMLKIFVLSLLFSAIFIMSQSLLIVILVHALIDVLSGIVMVHFANNS
jgi:membrane protease YdiL (CAAX protease family)